MNDDPLQVSRSITSLIHDGGGEDGGDDVHENEEEQSIGERIRIRYCLRYNSPAVPTKLEIWHFEMKSGGPEKKESTNEISCENLNAYHYFKGSVKTCICTYIDQKSNKTESNGIQPKLVKIDQNQTDLIN